MNHDNDLVVITGTDSGIGAKLSEAFLAKGYKVLATYLQKPATETATNIRCDLREEKSIASVAEAAADLVQKGATLACLVNNAGVAFGGGIENLPLALYRENFEINFFGLVSLTQKLIPHLVKSKGRIILHGSAAGRTAAPFLSPYVSTKFALEGFADCLRRELLPYGIKVTLLETGGVDTPIWKGFETQDRSFMDRKFDKSMELFGKNFLGGPKGMSAEEAASKIMAVFEKKNPPARAIIAKSPMRERLIRSLPSGLLDKAFIKMFGMDYGEK
jgi:NAD(P)-dependent dehydrogenase (short-subunit alcohol dehydrogenase family)